MKSKYIISYSILLCIVAIFYISCNDSGNIITPGGSTTWASTYGGGLSDVSTSSCLNGDGSLVCCGYTISYGAGDNDILVVKIDQVGSLQWSKVLSALGNDQSSSIYPTADGGYVIAGQTTSFGAINEDICVIKLDASGNLSWSKLYQGPQTDIAVSIVQIGNGDYVVGGYTNSFGAGANDVLVMRLDGSGNIIWAKTYGTVENDYASSLRLTTDGGFIVAGYSYTVGISNVYVIKLTGDGSVTWSRTYGGYTFDKANDIQPSTNGYIIAGATKSFNLGPDEDALVMNIDPNGYIYPNGARTFGDSLLDDEATAVMQTSDGGFMVTGFTKLPAQSNNNIFMLQLYGNMVFNNEKTFGGSGEDIISSLKLRSSGNITISGSTNSFGAGSNDIFVLNVKSDGSSCLTSNSVVPPAGDPTSAMNVVDAPTSVNTVTGSILTLNAPYTTQSVAVTTNVQCTGH